jgi:hypothetical protein
LSRDTCISDNAMFQFNTAALLMQLLQVGSAEHASPHLTGPCTILLQEWKVTTKRHRGINDQGHTQGGGGEAAGLRTLPVIEI